MILRRLMIHLKEQNWFAVAIEFLIVVLGVVIGFQVTAWNQQRAIAAEARSNLGLIIGEIEQHRESYERRAIGASARLADVRLVSAGIADPASVRDNPGAFMRAVFYSRYQVYTPLSQSAYEGLEQSGEIMMIDDPLTIQQIRAYYHSQEEVDKVLKGGFDPWREYNFAMAGYLSAEEIDAITMAEITGTPLVGIEPDYANALAERLAADRNVVRWLPEREIFLGAIVAFDADLLEQADAIIVGLESLEAAP